MLRVGYNNYNKKNDHWWIMTPVNHVMHECVINAMKPTNVFIYFVSFIYKFSFQREFNGNFV